LEGYRDHEMDDHTLFAPFLCHSTVHSRVTTSSIFIQNARSPFGIVRHVGTDSAGARQSMVPFVIRVQPYARLAGRLSCVR
jgi:hypothetical protein